MCTLIVRSKLSKEILLDSLSNSLMDLFCCKTDNSIACFSNLVYLDLICLLSLTIRPSNGIIRPSSCRRHSSTILHPSCKPSDVNLLECLCHLLHCARVRLSILNL